MTRTTRATTGPPRTRRSPSPVDHPQPQMAAPDAESADPTHGPTRPPRRAASVAAGAQPAVPSTTPSARPPAAPGAGRAPGKDRPRRAGRRPRRRRRSGPHRALCRPPPRRSGVRRVGTATAWSRCRSGRTPRRRTGAAVGCALAARRTGTRPQSVSVQSRPSGRRPRLSSRPPQGVANDGQRHLGVGRELPAGAEVGERHTVRGWPARLGRTTSRRRRCTSRHPGPSRGRRRRATPGSAAQRPVGNPQCSHAVLLALGPAPGPRHEGGPPWLTSPDSHLSPHPLCC